MFSHLNPEQQKAVFTTKGRVLVLAGAGSGKTSVLVHRIAYLIQHQKVPPHAILGLTFTNKAAGEMRERVAKSVPLALAKQVTLCTFHSFCMQILRKEIHHLGYTHQFSLYDEKDVKRLLSNLVRHALEHEGDLPSLQTTMQKISQAKNQTLEEEEDPTWHDAFSKELIEKMQVCMRAYNAVDFDSLLSLTIELFEKYPEVLLQYQDRYQYIMIDEYQDTNPVQYKLAQLLSAKHKNLCVVGDDDQSIYGWRGAEVKHILHFSADAVIKLEQNYRSTPKILHAANQVIAHNTERHAKQLWSCLDSGDPILLFHAPTEMEEAQSVVSRMIWYRKHKQLQWKDMAILYRSNLLSRAFETALLQAVWEEGGQWRRGIPYAVYGGTEFYERAEIKDLLCYLRVLANPLDQEALLRILNVPRRGISEKALDLLTQYNRSRQVPLWEVLELVETEGFPLKEELSDKAISGIRSFLSLIRNTKKKMEMESLAPTFSWLVEEMNYKKAIQDDVKSDKMREFKWDNVLQCIDTLAKYEEEKQRQLEPASIADFLGSTLLGQDRQSFQERKELEDKVHLMTIHSAKGLEFAACFLVCLEDHIMPHEKSAAENGLEEERRLMYVALTRAKKHLTLSMARQRKKMGKEILTSPSRFLFEIPKEVLKITSWQTVDPS